MTALKEYIWPGNIRELRNVIERASIIFPNKVISAKNIRENLLRVNIPDSAEEKDTLWEMTSSLTEVDQNSDKDDENRISVPHPSHYKKWFDFLDKIDLRRHLSEVELILIESALKKINGSVSQ